MQYKVTMNLIGYVLVEAESLKDAREMIEKEIENSELHSFKVGALRFYLDGGEVTGFFDGQWDEIVE